MNRIFDLMRRRQSDVALFLFLTAGLVGAYSQAVLPARHGGERWNLAWNLAEHGSFANPFSTLPTGPTASNPPLASLITAGLIVLLRAPFLIYVASAFLSVLANAVTAALLPRLSCAFFRDPVPGVLASIFWMFTMQVIPGWDTNYTAAGLLSFACLSSWIFGNEMRLGARWAFVAGALAGALCLLNPASLLVWAPWLLYVFWSAGVRRQGARVTCAIILAVAFMIASAWCIRNQRTVGAFALRTGMGLSLYVANNNCAQPTIMEEEINGCYGKYHPNANRQEAEDFRALGEVAYDKTRSAEAKSWIRAHPKRFTELTLHRVIDFWFPAVDPIPTGFKLPEDFGVPDYVRKWNLREYRIVFAIWGATALSIFGMGLMTRDRLPVVWFVAASIALYPLMYYVTITEVRFRDPVLWLTLLPAGYFVCELIEGRITRAKKPAIETTRQMHVSSS